MIKKIIFTSLILGGLAFGSQTILADGHETSDGHKGKRMERIDLDGDGKISRSEFIAKHEEKFSKMDVDGDGFLSRNEMKDARGKMKDKMKEMREKRKEAASE